MSSLHPSVPAASASLDAVLASGAVRAVYQPIVRLHEDETVGYEALTRGPEGTDLERPDVLFAAARQAGRVADLDQLCVATAFDGALRAHLGRRAWLAVNVEPDALSSVPPRRVLDLIERATDELDVIVEITERMLTCDPAGLTAFVEGVRARGWRVALDDVGADPTSLALMPLIRPDVIKLDLRIVQRRASVEVARLVSAVNAEVERCGAVLLAEGIETEQHRSVALSMGALLGQGWLLGRPAPLPVRPPAPTWRLALPRRPSRWPSATAAAAAARPVSPWEVAVSRRRPRATRKDLLIEMSKHLEIEAETLGDAAVVLAAFQHARHFTPATRERFAGLARQAGLVVALGIGMAATPAPGVHGTDLGDDDPVVGEWDVAVLGPHFAAALVARDLGDSGPELDRRFEYVLTYDRDLVCEIAAALVARVGNGAHADEAMWG
jgi:EAL domain-containing protein (putative c-di-GMP-specific phosphodiesterase class I)